MFFLEDGQEFIKRISLNTRTLIVVFNEILIPQYSFSMTTITRRRIHRRKFVTLFQNHFIQNYIIFFAFILFFVYFYMSLMNMKDSNNFTCHAKMMHKNKNVRKKISK